MNPATTQVVPGSAGDLLLGLPLKKKAFFFRELATMVDAGVGIVKATRMAGQHSVPKIAEALAKALEDGGSLSGVLGRYPYYFGDFELALVAAGEAGGTLDQRLKDLATTLEAQYELRQKVISKLWYPLLVLHALVFLPTMPLMVLHGPATYAAATLGVLVPAWLLVFLAYAAYRLGGQNSGIRAGFDRLLGLVPILGGSLRTLGAARFLECLSQLYQAGMPVNRCLVLAARSSGNAVMAERLEPAAKLVDSGLTLTQALAATRALPPLALQMLETGEESGRMPELLAKTASYMHQEVEHTSQRVMTVLPVILMLIVGSIVGFFVIRFYTGMFEQLNRI